MSEERLKIAVFVDFDNIEIGVKTTLGGQFDVGVVLEALKERGEVVSKTAYGDWKRAGDHSRLLTQHAIKMVQRNLTPGGDKNGADINLALDAMEMAFTHDHINAFVIVGGDSDFITLVEKLKQYDKKVFVVGGRAFTSHILQRNCHEFIAYENLVASQTPRRQADRGVRPAATTPLSQVFPLVSRALKLLSDREVSPQLGLLKSTLLQLDSTFSERSYGTSTFRDFAEKLAEAGFVNLKHSGRNILVELRESEPPTDGAGDERAEPAHAAGERPSGAGPGDGAVPIDRGETPLSGAAVPFEPARVADAVSDVRRLLLSGSTSPRWPMYVRNVKQALRSVDRAWDERRYGFRSLVDLLRACQREGVFRLERDRKGVLRVFPGPSLHVTAPDLPSGDVPLSRDEVEETTAAQLVEEPMVEVIEEPSVDVEIEQPAVSVEAVVADGFAPPGRDHQPHEPPGPQPASAEKPRRRRVTSGSTRRSPSRARGTRTRVKKP
jgi:uncharacterized LabA/DUF88 family protein